ncbi:MAG TPA: peptide-methionine (S)-S-oxide reductase MsrA [Candidatus Binatia bacterium]|nr:peptide-methionine (S)-S-oxide reductase MsrA [Candidatus Binatia bacterium]
MSTTSPSPDPVTPFAPEPATFAATASAAEPGAPLPSASSLQAATFAGGCFWGVEDELRRIPGVVATRVGYTGGRTDHPTYPDVCRHTTGHAEAVEVLFDPDRVSYEQLVTAFLTEIHDPTQLNRQGPDVGDQYRSAVFVRDAEQREVAERVRARLEEEHRFRRPIVTQIAEAPRFWEAEGYHQQYFEKRGGGACHV